MITRSRRKPGRLARVVVVLRKTRILLRHTPIYAARRFGDPALVGLRRSYVPLGGIALKIYEVNEPMSKGLLIYTMCLAFGAVLACLLTVPEHAIFAGMGVLTVTAGVLGTALARDFRRMQVAREPSRPE